MKRPKVSICIPTYNQVEFLKRNLESILLQNYKDFEVIISDDSTNNQVELLVNEMFKGTDISYVYHKNPQSLGSPANWNKAVSLSQGEYIKILHHDDWFLSEASLEKFVAPLVNQTEIDFVFCASSILDVKTNVYYENTPDVGFIKELRENPLTLFNCNKIGAPSAILYRRACNILFDERLTYLVDVDFYIEVLKRKNNFYFISEKLIINTSNNATQVTSSSINKKIQVGEYSYLYNKQLNGAFPQKKYRVFFKQLFAWYKLNSLNEINSWGYEKPRPVWIFNVLLIQSKWRRK